MEEILKEYISGDMDAFEKLVNSLRKYLYVIAKARVFDENMVEDALQETFIVLYTNGHKIRDITKFKSWITTVLINECNRVMKNNKKLKLYYDNIEGKEIEVDDFEDLMERLDFYQIINGLSIEDRTIMSMYYSDGYTIKDISNIMKLNINTVKTKICRARDKIKKDLGGIC